MSAHPLPISITVGPARADARVFVDDCDVTRHVSALTLAADAGSTPVVTITFTNITVDVDGVADVIRALPVAPRKEAP